MIKRGISTPALAANIDILPTLIAACEVAGPVKPIDGQSFLPLLQGERLTAREVFAYYYGDRLEAIRQGRWKLHLKHDYRSYDDMKPAEHAGAPMKTQVKHTDLALYDLEADPGERTDVHATHLEVVARLQELAAKERAALDAGKRPVGQVPN